jgi:hypothetical protein
MRRLVLLVSAFALLAFPVAAKACDFRPSPSPAELAVARSALAVAHIGAKPKAAAKRHAVRAIAVR